MRSRLLLVPALVLTVPALAAAPAHASSTVRFASPTGTAAQDCLTVQTACNIEKAVNTGSDGDEVVLAPGTYTTSTTLNPGDSETLILHGPATGPRPVIKSSAPTALLVNGSQTEIHDVEFQHTGAGAIGFYVFATDVDIRRVVVRSNAETACTPGIDGAFGDSLCVATAAGATAVRVSYTGGSNTLNITNVTAIGVGMDSVGIALAAGNGTTAGLEASNVIAHATTDIQVTETGTGNAQLYLTHVNYDSISNTTGTVTLDAGTNQTAQPKFQETTYYHQAVGSPTINAGGNNPGVAPTDYDGEARINGVVDIGADEFYPDTTRPRTTMTKHPAKTTTKRKAKFTFISDEAGSTFICKLDKQKAKPCTSPKKVKKLKPGKHKFKVVAVDPSGNKDRTPAKFVWTIE